MKYLIFSFLRSSVDAKCGVGFPNVMPPEFGGKWGTECHNTLSVMPSAYSVVCIVTLKKYI